jgi:hypothetical protein
LLEGFAAGVGEFGLLRKFAAAIDILAGEQFDTKMGVALNAADGVNSRAEAEGNIRGPIAAAFAEFKQARNPGSSGSFGI